MGKKGEIVSFRPEIKVLDATIRDEIGRAHV